MDYQEHEIKILNINSQDLSEKLKALSAQEVFNDIRTITHFKNPQDTKEPFLKLTEEGKLKLSSHNKETHQEVKLVVSKKEECIELLKTLGYMPVSEVKAKRISYEWQGIDFDIDEFPQIPAFLEIDLGDSKQTIEYIFKKLDLEQNEKGEMSTPDIYKKYGLDYYALFKL